MPRISRLTMALAAGLMATAGAVAVAQQPGESSASNTISVRGQIDWIEKSDVAAMREGVLKNIEFQVHDRVEQGQPIGALHDRMARLTEARAEVAAKSEGAIRRAIAMKSVAVERLGRARNLETYKPGSVTRQEFKELEAEVMAAEAAVEEARDNIKLAEAELELAKQAVSEHIITAPFTGYITDKIKSPGEAVQANEPIVRLARIDMLRFHGYVPLESAAQVRIGDIVSVQASLDGIELPLNSKIFEGKITGISLEISSVGRPEVQVLAEIYETDNRDRPELSLRPGMQAEMTIHLGSANGGTPIATAGAPAQPSR